MDGGTLQSPRLERKVTVIKWMALIVPACLALSTFAGEQAQPQSENFFKRAGKAVAQDAKTGAKQAGKAFKDAGKAVGRGTGKAARQVGREMKESSHRTAEAARKTF